jgi:hypothetical protein
LREEEKMTTQYRAVNRIEHGTGGYDDKGKPNVQVFNPGDEVTGLDEDTMKQLWDAGVLQAWDPSDRPEDDRDVRIRELEAQIKALREEKKSDDQEHDEDNPDPVNRDPQDIPGVGSLPTPNTAEAAADLAGTSATEGKSAAPGGDQPTEKESTTATPTKTAPAKAAPAKAAPAKTE